MIKGRIHSIETMGLLDGPGIRTVFFLQGCPLKCKYCHNPDTITTKGGKEYTVDEVVKIAKRYKSYYRDTGGVTFSGGEALLQGAFLLEGIKALKAEGIHVALDTSGVGQTQYFKEILELVDLVILDIKHFNKVGYKDITGVSMKWSEAFMNAMDHYKNKLWIRHVMVPGYTDNFESMDQLFHYVLNWYKIIEKIEILPYHKLGSDKYFQLGLEDPFKDVKEMSKDQAMVFQEYLEAKMKKYRIAV